MCQPSPQRDANDRELIVPDVNGGVNAEKRRRSFFLNEEK